MASLICLPTAEREMFVATLLGNSLWLVALSYYIYITFLGYSSLNMLTRSDSQTVHMGKHGGVNVIHNSKCVYQGLTSFEFSYLKPDFLYEL